MDFAVVVDAPVGGMHEPMRYPLGWKVWIRSQNSPYPVHRTREAHHAMDVVGDLGATQLDGIEGGQHGYAMAATIKIASYTYSRCCPH